MTLDAVDSPLRLRLLRRLPNFRGKSRLARLLLSEPQKHRKTFITDRYGNRMVVPNLIEPVGFYLGINGIDEPEVMALLDRYVSADTVLLDVGANIGAICVPFAARAKQVIAIEASPAVLPFLRQNVNLSGRGKIQIVECAASMPGVESLPFYIPPMQKFGMGSSAPQFDVAPVSVPAETLDSIVSQFAKARVSAIKVDVEGYEAHVFLGAKELLHSSPAPVVVFEFLEWAEERAFPGRCGWAQQVLLDAGYKLWILGDFLKGKAPLSSPVVTGGYNLVAVK